jgi:crotonobetainyl-CoA:carnitine CoA-transferase CaiB-like acyl-CoA transferase
LREENGAEVIKFERPDGGDPARNMGPFPDDIPDPEKSGLFLYLNTSKKGITLNLKTETGKKIFKEMVKDADVLVENFEPRVMPSLGLDYQTLEKINPGLVMTSISNFGQNGPYRDYKAQELNVVALGGLMYMTGDPNREPLKEAGSTAQFTAGANAAAATLAACYEQKGTGNGQHVDISIMESALSLLDTQTMTWSRSRVVVKRNGNYNRARNWPGGAADSGVYPCKDGYIGVIFSRSDEIALGAALSGMDEFNDPDIGYMGFGRCVEDEKLNNLLSRAFLDRKKEELFHSAQEMRLFWGAVRDIEGVMKNAHYNERKFWIELDHPRAGQLTYSRLPFLMSETQTMAEPAPLLGEHNEVIFCGRLGYSKEDLARLREANVI